MPAADQPSTVQAAPAEASSDVIEVIGKRTDNTIEIDRRTYQVRETAHSAQKDALQLLRGLPAVTVTPDDRILVLGGGMTRLYIDGRPYLGNVSQYLRTLHGSDIERIEVVTNPSAQFSSEGAGGVINLFLRKTLDEGLSGDASLEESSYGFGLVDTTLNYKHGDWTYQLKGGGNVGTMARRSYHVRRSVQSQDSAEPTVNRENGAYRYDGTVGRLSLKATYELDSKTSLSGQIGGGGGHDIVTNKVDYTAVTPDFQPFFEHRRLSSHASYVTGQFNLDHRGSRDGETLSASVQFYTNPQVHDVTKARFSNDRRYLIDLRKPSHSIDTKLDWKHPMATGQMLSLGGSWHVDGTSQDYQFTSNDSASLGEDTTDAYDARSSTLAIYTSLQQTFGALTLAPGLRGEANSRRISSPGMEDVHLDRAQLFPSFHASYKASKTLQIGASYSKRIERVPLEYLRPYGSVEGAYTLFEGNPGLKDQSTDAYELSVQFHPGKIEASATVYLRETSRLWSKSYSVNAAGTSVYTYVNAGSSWKRGAQFDLGMPVLSRLKARASVSLFDEQSPVDTYEGSDLQRNFRYSTNGTLEWNGKERDNAPGDVAQVQWSYNSPSREYQIRKSSWFDLSASYTHSFDRTLSLTGTFRYAGRSRQRLIAPSVEEMSSRQRTPEFQLKLHKTL
ncbi:TonB-dependent receptor [Novosphingobium mangrovi (ex Huang et al. 2023)]|uniref:TonB-dependent receptor n=1 Tax=Novosphingobium mangrovi (ex Huang et al. 2023) TaxID=2976432 RepID=A0ABT2I655_9SPHN|nr:TonB-dependent receptor [Novosphingobium mangrovi (ex Huang et al. 2023)]MCT2400293.1 TonB-dependent receptor [Novosphingobium mangrovi (ex Huang et al. 2023)]